MQKYAEEKGFMSQPRRMLNYSSELTNRANITSLLLFQLKLGLICKETYRFAKYTPVKCLDSLCNLLSMLVVKETRISIPVLSQKIGRLQKTCMAIKIWIAVAIQLQGTRMMKRYMQR